MKISYNWLRDYIPTTLTPEQISDALTSIGLEVEAMEIVETVKGGLEGVIVAEVLTCEKHPDADKLKITTVEYGQGPVQVVCGAPNVAAGQKVLLATQGSTIYPSDVPDGIKIKKSKIRGAESCGMICAEDELGLGASHEGIMVLDAGAVVGTPARDYFQLENDCIFEIGLTPNRIDAASHFGVARDLSAYLYANGQGLAARLPSVERFRVDNHDRKVDVIVEQKEGAPRYMGVTLTGVQVKPSPEWLQNKLRAIGINPKNNVVDITNFILHETGQPLHAFDADHIEGDTILVKTCPEGTPFVTLDGVEHTLSAEDLMICSEKRPMCIAGVFGGLDSGVTEQTTNVFIESAYFNPVWVRKAARRHGLNTDSSFRFERGADPCMAPYALKRAAVLIKECAGGTISSDIMDVCSGDFAPFEVELSYARINRLVGKELSPDTVKTILEGLQIRVVSENDEGLKVHVPQYRVDVQREADVIEEILRIYGYNNIEIPVQVNSTLSYAPKPDKDRIVNAASDLLTSIGYTEIMSNSLTKAAYYEDLVAYPLQHCVRILNPLSNDLNVMRQTLLFNALEAVELNSNRRNGDLCMYELGNCYFYDASKKNPERPLSAYREKYRMGITVTGMDGGPVWNRKPEKTGFYTLKYAVEKMLLRFGFNMDEGTYETAASDLYDEAVVFSIRGRQLLEMGIVSRAIRKTFDIKADVYFAEIDFDALVKMVAQNKVVYREISKYPEVKRDLALLVDKNVTFSQLRAIAVKTEKKLLKNVTLFDVYEGDKLPEGKKSYALSFVLEDPTRTLTDVIIDKTMEGLIRQFESQAGAEIRS